MCLSTAPIEGGQVCSLADWVEFNVLTSEFRQYRFADLRRIIDEQQAQENPDIAEQDSISEQIQESVIEELNHRVRSLAYAYPFSFHSDSQKLILCDDYTVGHYVYLYCLFYSHVNREDVLIPSSPIGKKGWDIMQICSTYAAAGIVNGNSVSFGSPRPDKSSFFQALKKTYEAFGEVKVRQRRRAGASIAVKDAGIDIIAWENSNDGLPGYRYLLGQVASGANWKDKTVRNDIKLFHDDWFFDEPKSTPSPAMFIPFCIDSAHGDSRNETFGGLTGAFGEIYYRCRIPRFAQDGWDLAANDSNGEFRIDRINEIDKLKNYVNEFMTVIS